MSSVCKIILEIIVVGWFLLMPCIAYHQYNTVNRMQYYAASHGFAKFDAYGKFSWEAVLIRVKDDGSYEIKGDGLP